MANAHRIYIAGQLPFDFATRLDADDAAFILRVLHTPTTGLRISWSENELYYMPNEHGGKTAIYSFVVQGTEAIAFAAIERLRDLYEAHGEVFDFKVTDIDNKETLAG
jgi:hypothetical protein